MTPDYELSAAINECVGTRRVDGGVHQVAGGEHRRPDGALRLGGRSAAAVSRGAGHRHPPASAQRFPRRADRALVPAACSTSGPTPTTRWRTSTPSSRRDSPARRSPAISPHKGSAEQSREREREEDGGMRRRTSFASRRARGGRSRRDLRGGGRGVGDGFGSAREPGADGYLAHPVRPRVALGCPLHAAERRSEFRRPPELHPRRRR